MISDKASNRWMLGFLIVVFIGIVSMITITCIDDHNKYMSMCNEYCECAGNCSYTFNYYEIRNCDCEGN